MSIAIEDRSVILTWGKGGITHGVYAKIESNGVELSLWEVNQDFRDEWTIGNGKPLTWSGCNFFENILGNRARVFVPIKPGFWQRKQSFEQRVSDVIDKMKKVQFRIVADRTEEVKDKVDNVVRTYKERESHGRVLS